MWPIFEFRPLPGFFMPGECWRYAEGKWIQDDGEYDLAFCGQARGERGSYPCGLMVDLPYQRNILWSWKDGHWSQPNHKHPRGNPWHYALRDGTSDWGGDWGRDVHPNRRAGDAAMSKACSMYSCANGRHVEFRGHNKHIAAGLLRERDTGIVVTFPTNARCMYCRDVFAPKPAEAVAA